MAKVKNRRDNHVTKRPKSSAAYGESRGTRQVREERRSGKRDFAPETGRPYGGERGDRRGSYDRQDFREGGEEQNPNILIGRNPVTEALKSGREIEKLMVSSREGSMIKILAMAKDAGIPVMYVEKVAMDRVAGGRPHQGVIAYVSAYEYKELEDIFAKAQKRGEEPFLVILDGLEDPHNLGAIMRTAECAGAHGIIIPKRRACGLTEVVAKASAGAIEYMPVVKVTNIAQTIDELKEMGIWIAACDMGGEAYYKADLKGKLAVVIGSEGFGISKLVKDKCDFTVSMPMVGEISSLNASNAAAVIMYEARRQRDER